MSMHETMKRLYAATVGRDAGYGVQTELANLLGVSAQVVGNWERRGISKDGLLAAEERMGISPAWIKTGIGDPRKEPTAGKIAVTLDGASGTQETPLTDEAKRLGRLLDLIPESDLIKRATAYNAASAAIVSVLEGHKPAPTVQPAQGQKTLPA